MKKLLLIILSVLMLFTTAACKKKDNGGKEDPVIDNIETEVQKRFDELQKQWFKEDMESDYTNVHFSIVEPAKYGIKDLEVTLGDVSYEMTEEDKKSLDDLKARIEKLKEFKLEDLTADQQIMYECMQYYFDLNIGFYETEKDYTFAFTPNSGNNNNLITLFTEFDFRNEQDFRDYITLLKDTGRYIDQCIEYTRRQAADGIVQPDSVIDSVIEQCERFTANVDNNEVIKVFVEAINKVNMTGSQELIDEVTAAAKEILIPAYKRIIEFYDSELRGKCTTSGVMADYEGGKELYSLIVRNKISTDKSVAEIENDVEAALEGAYNRIIRNSRVSITEGYGFSDPYEIFSHLISSMANDFPDIPKVDYTIAFLDKSVTSDNNSAYYLIAPIDDPNKNVVKVNPTFVERDPDGLCITLAHEGYPGHLYQHSYYSINHPGNEYRYVMDFLGYAEGWAEYCENRAYNYFLKNSKEVAYLQDNNMFSYLMYAYTDLKMHYDGWGIKEIEQFLSSYFVESYAEQIAPDIYETNLGDPGLFLPYGAGMMYMTNMMEDAKSAMGNKFDFKAYNKVVLDTGAAPFHILQKQVQKYIDKNK